ncbi:LIC_20245 family lipoprotein [Leptospira selangorensis]|uniref:LIC_20245 family lipoprotein n=1 Tax=Leptospira selangorensis TaxID=2484982 RepID=UPI003CC589D5
MTRVRTLLISVVFIVFFILLLVVSFWTDDDGSDSKNKQSEAEALASIFGGGSGSTSGRSGYGKTGADPSLFDSNSDFYKAGKAEYREPEVGEPSSENKSGAPASDSNNPVNPQTGKPYTNEEMERFAQLKEKFPNNSLLPSRMTPAEKEQRKVFEQRVSEATRAVLSRTASKDQTVTYYDYMEKQSKDRLEIVKYLVDLQKGSGDPEQEKKLETIQQTMIQQLEQVQKDKQRAYEQAGL